MQNCVIPLLHNSVLRWVFKFCSISFKKISFSQRKCERKRKFLFIFAKVDRNFYEIRNIRSKISTFPAKSYFIRKNTLFLMWNGKFSIFNGPKLNENFPKERSRIHRNPRKCWTKMNEFRSFNLANLVQRKFLWNFYLRYFA